MGVFTQLCVCVCVCERARTRARLLLSVVDSFVCSKQLHSYLGLHQIFLSLPPRPIRRPHISVHSPQIIYTLSDIFRQSHTYPYIHLKLSTLCQISSETKPHIPVHSPQIIYTLSDIFRDKATHTRTFTSNYLHFVRYLQRQSHTYPYIHLR